MQVTLGFLPVAGSRAVSLRSEVDEDLLGTSVAQPDPRFRQFRVALDAFPGEFDRPIRISGIVAEQKPHPRDLRQAGPGATVFRIQFHRLGEELFGAIETGLAILKKLPPTTHVVLVRRDGRATIGLLGFERRVRRLQTPKNVRRHTLLQLEQVVQRLGGLPVRTRLASLVHPAASSGQSGRPNLE